MLYCRLTFYLVSIFLYDYMFLISRLDYLSLSLFSLIKQLLRSYGQFVLVYREPDTDSRGSHPDLHPDPHNSTMIKEMINLILISRNSWQCAPLTWRDSTGSQLSCRTVTGLCCLWVWANYLLNSVEYDVPGEGGPELLVLVRQDPTQLRSLLH